jgi:hypothetical protein
MEELISRDKAEMEKCVFGTPVELAVLQILKLAREHLTSGYISGGDCLELLFESKYAALGEQALLLAHHVNQFNPCQRDTG